MRHLDVLVECTYTNFMRNCVERFLRPLYTSMRSALMMVWKYRPQAINPYSLRRSQSDLPRNIATQYS